MPIAATLSQKLKTYIGEKDLGLYKALSSIALLGLDDDDTNQLIGIACLTYRNEFTFNQANTSKSLVWVLNQILDSNTRKRISSLGETANTDVANMSSGQIFGVAYAKPHAKFAEEFAISFMGREKFDEYNNPKPDNNTSPLLNSEGKLLYAPYQAHSIALAPRTYKQKLGEYVFAYFNENAESFNIQQFLVMIDLIKLAPGNVRLTPQITARLISVTNEERVAAEFYMINLCYILYRQKSCLVPKIIADNLCSNKGIADITMQRITEIISKSENQEEALIKLLVKECVFLRKEGSVQLMDKLIPFANEVLKDVEINGKKYVDLLLARNTAYQQERNDSFFNKSNYYKDPVASFMQKHEATDYPHPIDIIYNEYVSTNKAILSSQDNTIEYHR